MNATTKTSWFWILALGGTAIVGCDARSAAPLPITTTSLAALPAQPVAPVVTAAPAVVAVSEKPNTPPVAIATPPKVATSTDANLRVKRLVIADAVANREPVDPETAFDGKKTDRIYAFVEVENPSKDKSQIVVEFAPPNGGTPRGNVTLDVGPSPRWRTWAFTRDARVAGEWTAIVKTESGKVLAKTPFTITS